MRLSTATLLLVSTAMAQNAIKYETVVKTVTPTVWKTVTVTDDVDDTAAATDAADATAAEAAASSSSTSTKEATTAPVVAAVATTPKTLVVSSSSSAAAAASTGSSSSGSGSTHTERTTFYTPGLGACGTTDSEADAVVAIGKDYYDATRVKSGGVSSLCGKYINVSYGGKSIKAKIVDRCEACPYYGLDMSRSAFKSLANPDSGVIQASWSFA